MPVGLLTLYVFAPVAGAAVVLCLPRTKENLIRAVSVAAAAVPFAIAAYLFYAFQPSEADLQAAWTERHAWIPSFNIEYYLGLDGLSAPMIVLSGLVSLIAVISSFGIRENVKAYFALFLLLVTGMNGVFCSLDFFLFYVFWEVMLLPMYFLIGIWGGPQKVYAAVKFFLFTLAGSVLMLVAMLALYYWSGDSMHLDAKGQPTPLLLEAKLDAYAAGGEKGTRSGKPLSELQEIEARSRRVAAAPALTADEAADLSDARGSAGAIRFDKTLRLPELRQRWRLFTGGFQLFGWTLGFAGVMFVLLFVAFAVKVPVFPFHTWLPWAHVEAPTPISVILAAILLKMGTYGFLRVSWPLLPTAVSDFAVPVAVLAVINILYGALCAMAQSDMKKLVAYSSISHLGFAMLGLAALTHEALVGATYQMFGHGITSAMMFLIVGVVYDRAHHRRIDGFGGIRTQVPKYTTVAAMGVFAGLGLPGLCGFPGEFLSLLGAFRSDMPLTGGAVWGNALTFQTITILSALGVIVTAAYFLWMFQRVFLGPLNAEYGPGGKHELTDINARELVCLVPLGIAALVFGVYPQALISLMESSLLDLMTFVRHACLVS